jgi:hypothetical protein
MTMNTQNLGKAATTTVGILTAILTLSTLAGSDFAAPALAVTAATEGNQTGANITSSSSSPQSTKNDLEEAIKAIHTGNSKDAMSRMNSTAAQTLSSANSASAISVTSDIKTAIDSLKNGNSKDAIMHLNQAVGHFSK